MFLFLVPSFNDNVLVVFSTVSWLLAFCTLYVKPQFSHSVTGFVKNSKYFYSDSHIPLFCFSCSCGHCSFYL